MHPIFWRLALVCCFSSGLLLTGCSPSAGKSWGSSGSSAFQSDGQTSTTYAIQRLTCDGRVYLFLAANRCKGSGGGGGDGGGRGQFHTNDGRDIDWSCATRDGRTGHVVIDGQKFDLAQGGLFLILTSDPPTRVEQLALDPALLPENPGPEPFTELGKSNPKIATFLESCRETK